MDEGNTPLNLFGFGVKEGGIGIDERAFLFLEIGDSDVCCVDQVKNIVAKV